jgi:hypothetical protein
VEADASQVYVAPLLRFVVAVAVTLPILLLVGGYLVFGFLALISRLAHLLRRHPHPAARAGGDKPLWD